MSSIRIGLSYDAAWLVPGRLPVEAKGVDILVFPELVDGRYGPVSFRNRSRYASSDLWGRAPAARAAYPPSTSSGKISMSTPFASTGTPPVTSHAASYENPIRMLDMGVA